MWSRILLVSSGIWKKFCSCDFVMCSSHSSSSPSRFWVDSSFLDHFDSFLLPWFELWRELSLFTKENLPIPHELEDRAISWSRSKKPMFFCSSSISHDRLEIRCWCLEDIFSTLLRIYLQSFKSIRVVLIEFWPVLPWFVLLFLDSAEPPGKTRNLWDAEPPGKNMEPPGISKPRSLWGKMQSLRTCCWKFVFGLSECSLWDPSFALIF
jgi:hypothetical protein